MSNKELLMLKGFIQWALSKYYMKDYEKFLSLTDPIRDIIDEAAKEPLNLDQYSLRDEEFLKLF